MAVVVLKSASMTSLDASPPVRPDVTVFGGRVRVISGTVEVTNGDSIGSTVLMGRVPSLARVHSIRIFCDAITSAAADIGLYRTTQDGSAVVDVDAYASAQTIASANVLGIEVAYEARDIANIERRVWQDAAATADTGYLYDIVATLTAAATASGTLSWQIFYTLD